MFLLGPYDILSKSINEVGEIFNLLDTEGPHLKRILGLEKNCVTQNLR